MPPHDPSTPAATGRASHEIDAILRAGGAPPDHHGLQLYEDDAFLADAVARFVLPALAAGEPAVVIATAAHRDALERRLADARIDVAEARRRGRYVALDAADTLSRFMVGDAPDAARFGEVVGGILTGAAMRAGGAPVRAFGEMVALLWADGRRDAALRLEELWNEVARCIPFAILCGYPLAGFASWAHGDRFAKICAAHSRVIPAEGYPLLGEDDDRLRVIADLQRRAAALEAEVAAREAAEVALRRQHAEMAEFFDDAAVPIHWVGADGTILRANRAELDLLGYAAGEYVGHYVGEFHVDRHALRDFLERLAAGETVRGFEAVLRCRDGSLKHVAIDSNGFFADGRFVHIRSFTRDVTDLKRAADAQARLAAIVESSDDAIVGKTLEGIVTSWNAAAERIFGYTADEVIGQSILRLIPPERHDDLARILQAVRRGERVDHFETERVRKDGRRIHVSLTVSPIRDASGRVVGASKIARDVSRRKAADAEVERLLGVAERARAEAEAANRAKDEFLSVVSHEIRTPLASILGWAGVLKAGVTGERAARAIDTIERSGRAQAKLIEDLLDVSRIVGGRMRLDLRLVDLPPILGAALDTVRPAAEAKGVRLATRLDPSAGPVAGDADRLQQIAWNLLSNAVKFTPAGGLVEMRLERLDQDVRLTVRDTGRGIAPEFLPFVFERFRQADPAESRRTGGLGLGLAIVRHLVELHGGGVAVSSPGVGLGSTFTVTLPLTPLHDAAGDEVPAPLLLHGVRVLLVEDEPDARDALHLILQSHGARVTATDSVPAARVALRMEQPDILISDLCLPGEDGYALIRELRAARGAHAVPAIAVTGYDDDRAIAAGYRVRLRKPVEPELLLTAVAQLVARPKLP